MIVNEFIVTLDKLLSEIDRALIEGSWKTVTHATRRTLEEILIRVTKDILDESPSNNLHNLLKHIDKINKKTELFPQRLIARMWFVKKIGDAGSHGGHEVTEDDAKRSKDDIEEIVSYVIKTFVIDDFKHMFDRPDLDIVITDDLSKLVFKYKGNNLKINNPVLLYESCRGGNEIFGFDKEEYATRNFLDTHDQRDSVAKTLGHRNRIHYNGVNIVWDQDQCAWPPSIDSLLIASTILSNNELKNILSDVSSIAEVGCGTGFVSAIICKHFSIEHLILTDLDDSILNLANFNVRINCSDQNIIPLKGNALLPFMINNLQCDVLFANPPYLVTGGQLETFSSTRSTGLLEELISGFWQYSKYLILNYSSCSLNRISDIQQKIGVKLNEQVLASKKVPFRIPGSNIKDIDELKRERLIIDLEDQGDRKENPHLCDDNRGFRYWHEIYVSIFTQNTDEHNQ